MERIPILKIGSCLLVTVQVDLHDELALRLQADLADAIDRHAARGVLLDISALDIVDSFIGRVIADISAISRLQNAVTVVVGMQPAVAITLVELGLTLPGIMTATNAERGMRLLNSAQRQARG